MPRRFKVKLVLVLSLSLLGGVLSNQTLADVELCPLFSDDMMLQRDVPVYLWGRADPGEKVTVAFLTGLYTTRADGKGKWRIVLPPHDAGTSGELVVIGNNRVEIKDVIFGDVWICSGQSNMVMPVISAAAGMEESERASYPEIRLFQVEKTVTGEPTDDIDGSWKRCAPESACRFSAVGYYFGRHIHKTLNIPVGLIESTRSGTPAELWTPIEALEAEPDLAYLVEGWSEVRDDRQTAWVDAQKARNRKIGTRGHRDPGNFGFEKGWADPDLEDSHWMKMDLPCFWEESGLVIDGAVWFRKAVDIPSSWRDGDMILELGPVYDSDTTYFNGIEVGSTANGTSRRYPIPLALVQAGRNVIAVRVFDGKRNGGICGDPGDLRLVRGEATVPLQGAWAYKVEHMLNPMEFVHGPLEVRFMPSGLFNGMIAPLTPMPIKGVIWYQGEANVPRAYEYRKLFPTLIRSWRAAWNRDDLPFLYVQLANYRKTRPFPGPSPWAELREAQLMALALPHTGMAVAIDIGEADDIHPKNKQDVGTRLALSALARVYGKELPHSGPLYESRSLEDGRIRIKFKHAEGGLIAKGGSEPKGFAVAGKDGKFVWARARIDGDVVIVWSEEVKEPVHVRYGWADNPDVNLYNRAGLPASPFRTDRRPGITVNNR